MSNARRAAGRGATHSPAHEAEFRRLVDEARDRHNISDVVARSRKVTRAGRERRALCAFHSERSPSMQLNDAKGTYHCFGCRASGDVVKYVMETERIGFMDALRWLGAANLPAVNPDARARAVEEDAAEREAAIAEARRFWEQCGPLPGTDGDRYLSGRGIDIRPDAFRFGQVPAWRDKSTGEWGKRLPALLGAVTIGDDVVAAQRIFLRDQGRAKANMKRPKLSIGRVLGGAIWIGPPANEVVITEGPEDALSLAQEMPGRTVLAALGTAFMPAIIFPEIVTSILIAGQNDKAGTAAVDAAAEALLSKGFAVSVMWPDEGFKDWNDQLRGIRL